VPRDPEKEDAAFDFRVEGREIVYRVGKERAADLEQLGRILKEIRADRSNWRAVRGSTVLEPPVVRIAGPLEMRVADLVEVIDAATAASFVEIAPAGLEDVRLDLVTPDIAPYDGVVPPAAAYTVPAVIAAVDVVHGRADQRFESREGLVATLTKGEIPKVREHFDALLEMARADDLVVSTPTPGGMVERVTEPLLFHVDEWCYWSSAAVVMKEARQRGFVRLALACRRKGE